VSIGTRRETLEHKSGFRAWLADSAAKVEHAKAYGRMAFSIREKDGGTMSASALSVSVHQSLSLSLSLSLSVCVCMCVRVWI